MINKTTVWQPLATCSVEGDLCTVTPLEGATCSFLVYDHFRIGGVSGWLSGYWQEVLMPSGKFQRAPICPVPFRRFEVMEQTERRLVLRILK